METGIREAKNNLSALIKAAQAGEEVFLTCRGERVAAIVPVSGRSDPGHGRGLWKGRMPENWEDEYFRAKKHTEAEMSAE